MWVGQNDKIGDVDDANFVRGQLQNIEDFHVVEGFYHSGFSDGNHDSEPYMKEVVAFLKRHI